MSERDVLSQENLRDLNGVIVNVVEWLSVVENTNHYDGESIRFGYYDAPQNGPIRHGGIYVGVHRNYYGEESDGYRDWYQLGLLYPRSMPMQIANIL